MQGIQRLATAGVAAASAVWSAGYARTPKHDQEHPIPKTSKKEPTPGRVVLPRNNVTHMAAATLPPPFGAMCRPAKKPAAQSPGTLDLPALNAAEASAVIVATLD